MLPFSVQNFYHELIEILIPRIKKYKVGRDNCLSKNTERILIMHAVMSEVQDDQDSNLIIDVNIESRQDFIKFKMDYRSIF